MIALHAMRSGCPNGQGGNNFQHKRDAGTLPSFQDVTSVPVVYPKSGIKISMLTTAYPGELRGTYTPAQLQREGVQAQQTFQGLHYQQETQASIQSTQCQHRCYPVTASYSLQTDIRKENLSDSKSFDTPSWSEKSNGNIERQQGQQVRGSLAAPNCGYTRTHNLEHSGGTPSILPVLPDGESQIYAQIEDYIAKKLAYFRTVLTHNNSHYGHSHKEWDEDPTLQSPCIMPNVHSVVHLPTTSAADKDVEGQTLNCAVIEQRTVAVGQAVEEDSSKGIKANTEFMTTSKEIDGYTTSASEKHSTGASVGEGYKWSEKPTKADYFPEPDFFRVRKKYRYSQ
ncbi:uncharacterized protein LOC131960500 isoform X2 [Centropristis striata]|uniref:uncharacterized protein LOC131960500 isoform X2 n=1 Tax=Centropristis striata TaxID=184440 RepID=UPI0027E091A7|nr:uncharacterized protein LOC131960500 isoform X2 [Centropristis striata]